MPGSGDDSIRLYALLSALADSAEQDSPASFVEGESSTAVDGVANETRKALLNAFAGSKKERLQRAKKNYERAVRYASARRAQLPAAPEERRALLYAVLNRVPGMRSGLVTMQHRNLESFSDKDVETALEQLATLGLLDEETGKK